MCKLGSDIKTSRDRQHQYNLEQNCSGLLTHLKTRNNLYLTQIQNVYHRPTKRHVYVLMPRLPTAIHWFETKILGQGSTHYAPEIMEAWYCVERSTFNRHIHI